MKPSVKIQFGTQWHAIFSIVTRRDFKVINSRGYSAKYRVPSRSSVPGRRLEK
jgi:hypothetical protein